MADRPVLFFATILIAVVYKADALRPLSAEQIQLYTKVYDAYVAQNLSYDCFRYSDHNSVAHCDCLACLKAQPNFIEGMCRFREAQETIHNDGEKADRDPNNIWHTICDPKCRRRRPTKCCDPDKGTPQIENGCVTCLPVKDSIGKHPSCFVAELEAHRKNSKITWQQRYGLYRKAMEDADLSPKCVSYVIVKSANECDCKPCLQSEKSTKELREKFCKTAENIRNDEQLQRAGYWLDRPYFENFCNFTKCPDMPRKCCTAPGKLESASIEYKEDSNGCPACMPTSELYGFGPFCESKFLRLPSSTYDKISSKLSHEP